MKPAFALLAALLLPSFTALCAVEAPRPRNGPKLLATETLGSVKPADPKP